MSNLTEDRGSYTALYLNGLWDNFRDTLWSVLPPNFTFLDGKNFHQLEISESDPEATEITDPESLIVALITKANRLSENALSVSIEDNTIRTDVFDKIGEHGGRISTYIPDLSKVVSDFELNSPNMTSRYWSTVIAQNNFDIIHSPNLVDAKDFVLNDSMVSFPSYLNQGSSNLFAMQTFFNTSNLANSFINGGNQLLIGNEGSEWIDINLNQSSTNNYLANKNISKDRTPIKSINIQNAKSVLENTFIRTAEGYSVPTSLLPKTTLNKALDLVNSSNLETEISRPYNFEPHSTLIFDLDTETITSYEKNITNSSGQGWFSDGFLGSEEFDDLGFNAWNVGKSELLTEANFGIPVDSVDAFGNGYEDWFVGLANELSEELHWFNFPEGITPKKPSCSSDTTSNGVTEDLSSQINGSNQVFTISQSYESGTIKVYWNGQRQHDLTITEINSTTFRTSFIPVNGNAIIVDYLPF